MLPDPLEVGSGWLNAVSLWPLLLFASLSGMLVHVSTLPAMSGV